MVFFLEKSEIERTQAGTNPNAKPYYALERKRIPDELEKKFQP